MAEQRPRARPAAPSRAGPLPVLGFEPEQGFFEARMLPGELTDQARELRDAGRVFRPPAMACKGPFSLREMLCMPPDEHGGMDLIRTRGLGRGLPGFERADPLPRELAGKATSFESQGDGRLSILQEAELRVSVKGCSPKVILFFTVENMKEMLFIKERGEDPSDLIMDMIERFYLQHE
jgi:hypothetical protein